MFYRLLADKLDEPEEKPVPKAHPTRTRFSEIVKALLDHSEKHNTTDTYR